MRNDKIVPLLGVCLFISGLYCLIVGYDSRYHIEISKISSFLLIGIGAFITIYGSFKCESSYKSSITMICRKCEKIYFDKKQEAKCDVCLDTLEALAGYYERHHADKEGEH